jgi:hypothetical protein
MLAGAVAFAIAVLLLGIAANAAAAAGAEGGIVGQLLGAVTHTAADVAGGEVVPTASTQTPSDASTEQSPDGAPAATGDGADSAETGAPTTTSTGAPQGSDGTKSTSTAVKPTVASLVGVVSPQRSVRHLPVHPLPIVVPEPVATVSSGVVHTVSGDVTRVLKVARDGVQPVVSILPGANVAEPPLGFPNGPVQVGQVTLGPIVQGGPTLIEGLSSLSLPTSSPETTTTLSPATIISWAGGAAVTPIADVGSVNRPAPSTGLNASSPAIVGHNATTPATSAGRSPSNSSSSSTPFPTAPHGPGQGGFSSTAAAAACGVGIALALAWLLAIWPPVRTRRRHPHAELWRASAFELLLERPG